MSNMKIIIAEKIGMTRVFDKDNKSIAVSVLKAGPCNITETKNNTVKIEYKKTSAGKKTPKIIKQFNIDDKEKEIFQNVKEISANIFKINERIDVVGISKGKGFAGVMKRHGFKGMPASHGHEKERIPGSIGGRFPQRVTKGKRMAGHMGDKQVTIKNMKILDIDEENNIIAVQGSTPGCPGKILFLKSK